MTYCQRCFKEMQDVLDKADKARFRALLYGMAIGFMLSFPFRDLWR
jgi:hypothetical protein